MVFILAFSLSACWWLICCGVDGDGIGACNIWEVAVVLAALVVVVAIGVGVVGVLYIYASEASKYLSLVCSLFVCGGCTALAFLPPSP